ncbi:hypothetical protein [Salinivibrio sp. SS2]|uniref:hypothetical protein n=1 Tax=Salinivibrio sp. SS2 TaxID=1892894 RepID=UPI00084C249D|nr:hypothetical protein [Salinivibrio sp. DV]ODQ00624.1 hypothetical protein BGK46_06125 [Salinivibrio sp. DV]
MRKLLLILCFLLAPVSNATEPQKTISINEGSSIVVEGIKKIFPERSKVALNLVPWSVVQRVERIAKPADEFDITPMSHLYQSSQNTLPKSEFTILERSFDALLPIGFWVVTVLLLVILPLKFYDAITSLRSSDEAESEKGTKKLRLAVLETVSFSVIAMYLSPYAVQGGAVVVLPLAVTITVWLCMSALVNGVLSVMVDFSNPVNEQQKGADKIADVQLILKNHITATVQARLIYDGLLDTSLVEHQIASANPDKFEVTNHSIAMIGEAQRELEASRTGEYFSRADCLLRKSWSQVAQTDPRCGWALEAATGLGVLDSRLQVQSNEPSQAVLSPDQERLLTALTPMIETELDKYTAYKKALACVQRHGLETYTYNLDHSFFCKVRRDDFSLFDDQYYGYQHGENGRLIAVDAFNTADSNYDFSQFDNAIETLLKKEFRRVSQDTLGQVISHQGEHYNRGLMLSLPTFSQIQTVEKNSHDIAFDEAVRQVGVDTKTALEAFFSTQPKHSRTLMGIDDKDEVKAYLDKFFPYITRTWFEPTKHNVSFQLSELAKGVIGSVDPSDSLGIATGAVKRVMDLGVAFYGLQAIASITSTNLPFLGGLGLLFLLVAEVLQFALMLLMFGFLLKLVLHHVFLRLMVSPLFFTVNVIKRQIEDLKNVGKNQSDDVQWVGFVKSELINPPVMLILGVTSWLCGVMLFNSICGMAMMLIKIFPWFQGEGVLTYLALNVLVYPAAFTFLGYLLCYKLPFDLYRYITANLGDEMSPLSVEDDTITGLFNKAKITTLVK